MDSDKAAKESEVLTLCALALLRVKSLPFLVSPKLNLTKGKISWVQQRFLKSTDLIKSSPIP